MRITPSQVGKMAVAYTLTSVGALASHLGNYTDSPSASPTVSPCNDIHGNCDAWHHCTVDNQSCIWGISVTLFTVAACVAYAVGCGIYRVYKESGQREYRPVLGAAPEEQARLRGVIAQRSDSIVDIVDLANQPELGRPLNSTIQSGYQATISGTIEAEIEIPSTFKPTPSLNPKKVLSNEDLEAVTRL